MEVPSDPETYLHRIGRTGRFGTHGIAITFVCGDQDFQQLEKIKQTYHTEIQSLPDEIPKEYYLYELQTEEETKALQKMEEKKEALILKEKKKEEKEQEKKKLKQEKKQMKKMNQKEEHQKPEENPNFYYQNFYQSIPSYQNFYQPIPVYQSFYSPNSLDPNILSIYNSNIVPLV